MRGGEGKIGASQDSRENGKIARQIAPMVLLNFP
jgi:hypothetical protein